MQKLLWVALAVAAAATAWTTTATAGGGCATVACRICLAKVMQETGCADIRSSTPECRVAKSRANNECANL